MVQHHLIPARETRVEMVVVNSRFITTAAPAFSVEEAKAFIARIKKEFCGASHNVPLYLIGHESSLIAHCSDDGEPSGTAGRPALAVLRGSGLGNVAVVVTRYFGGTKLGTGGLVRAYSDAVRQVLAALPRAVQVPTHTVLLAVPYSAFERMRLLVQEHRGRILDEDFGADVTIEAQFPVERFAAFQATLQERSNGTLQAQVIETEDTIMPLGDTSD
jgi:uncharacterized YigZ family protein